MLQFNDFEGVLLDKIREPNLLPVGASEQEKKDFESGVKKFK